MASLPFVPPILSLSIYLSPPLHRLLRAHLPALLLWHWFILMYIYATKLKSQADLKWKLQLGSICVFILWTRMRSAMCARVCPRRCVEVHVCDRVWICTLLSFLNRSIFFIFKGGIPLHFATHCIPAFSALSIPLISGPNFRHGQVPHFFVSAWQDRWKWHSNLKQ